MFATTMTSYGWLIVLIVVSMDQTTARGNTYEVAKMIRDAKCSKPYPELVTIDTHHHFRHAEHFEPVTVRINQCSGSCGDADRFQCVSASNTTVKVMLGPNGKHPVPVNVHHKCRCECILSAVTCGVRGFDENRCECE